MLLKLWPAPHDVAQETQHYLGAAYTRMMRFFNILGLKKLGAAHLRGRLIREETRYFKNLLCLTHYGICTDR